MDPESGFEGRRILDYLEDPHNEPFVLRDMLYSEMDSRNVGDMRIEYERSFGEIKSQILDLRDLGVVELLESEPATSSRTKLGIDTEYKMTDEARKFFYGTPYTLSWAYQAAQNEFKEEKIEEQV